MFVIAQQQSRQHMNRERLQNTMRGVKYRQHQNMELG